MKQTSMTTRNLRKSIAVLTPGGSALVGQVFTPNGVVVVTSFPSATYYITTRLGAEFTRTDFHAGYGNRPTGKTIARIAGNFTRSIAKRYARPGKSGFVAAAPFTVAL